MVADLRSSIFLEKIFALGVVKELEWWDSKSLKAKDFEQSDDYVSQSLDL